MGSRPDGLSAITVVTAFSSQIHLRIASDFDLYGISNNSIIVSSLKAYYSLEGLFRFNVHWNFSTLSINVLLFLNRVEASDSSSPKH